MIDYDPHDWNSHLLDIRGSMVREIFARVALSVAWAAIVFVMDTYWGNVGVPTTVHALLGTAIGLLLVFRTNSSYDRFWEGRRMWGSIINESRNLGRCACTYLQPAPDLKRRLLLSTIAFAHASMHQLRGTPSLGDAAKHFSSEELQELAGPTHLPVRVARRISETLVEARDRGVISEHVLVMIDQNAQLLIDYIGACERIEKTPLPFAYMVHLRRALLLYCYTLPLALVNPFGWETIPLTFLVSYIFFGIEEIGVEIEGPFGQDENDLPLERFCAAIEVDLLDCLTTKADRPAVEV